MGWFRRTGGAGAGPPAGEDPGSPTEAEALPALERTAPGLAALTRGLTADGRHTILDLGPASEPNFRHHARFARRIRFFDLLVRSPGTGGWAAALEQVPVYADHAYDVVLAWNLLDRVGREERPEVVKRLVALAGPGARIHLITDMSGDALAHPLRFTLMDDQHVLQEAVSPPVPASPPLLPAEVERLLAPLRVEHAFTLRHGLREYVAVRPAPPR